MTGRRRFTVVRGEKPDTTPGQSARARYWEAARQQARELGTDKKRWYVDWQHGRVIPARITSALNLHGHQGPEVDKACGVEEPAVDMWEAGTLYPTWEQLQALAEICPQVTLGYFMLPFVEPLPLQTSLRFHRIGGKPAEWREPPPVLAYPPDVVWATVREHQP